MALKPVQKHSGPVRRLLNIIDEGSRDIRPSITTPFGKSTSGIGSTLHTNLVDMPSASNADHDDRYQQHHQQTVTVAKSGGEYTSIQDAIDSITDASSSKRYIVQIYPGIYTEDVVMEDYVSLTGLGQVPWETVIYGTNSDPLITFDTNSSESSISNIHLMLEPTTDAQSVVLQTNGTHALWQCTVSVTSATNGIAADMIEVLGGTFFAMFNQINYTMTGSAAGTKTHRTFRINGTGQYHLQGNRIDMSVADVGDTAVVLDEQSGGTQTEVLIVDNNIHLDMSHGSYTGNCGGFYLHGATSGIKTLHRNHIHIRSDGGGTGYGMYMNTAANNGVINSANNWLSVTGFATNYSVNVGPGDTVNADFNDITAADGATGAGTKNLVSSTTPGELTVSTAVNVADYTLPLADGTADQVIVTDGSGTLSFGGGASYWKRTGTLLEPATANDVASVTSNQVATVLSGIASGVDAIGVAGTSSGNQSTGAPIGAYGAATGSGGKGVVGTASGSGGDGVVGTVLSTALGENDTYGGKFTRVNDGDYADVEESSNTPLVAAPEAGYVRRAAGDDGRLYAFDSDANMHDLTVQHKQVFKGWDSASGAENETWDSDVYGAGISGISMTATLTGNFDFTNEGGETSYGSWEWLGFYEEILAQSQVSVWHPFRRFGDNNDNCRVIVRARIRVNDVNDFDHVYIGLNDVSAADAVVNTVKTDVLGSMSSNVWYDAIITADGTDIGSWNDFLRCWVWAQGKTYTSYQEPTKAQIDIEQISVEQWAN